MLTAGGMSPKGQCWREQISWCVWTCRGEMNRAGECGVELVRRAAAPFLFLTSGKTKIQKKEMQG